MTITIMMMMMLVVTMADAEGILISLMLVHTCYNIEVLA